MRSNHDHSSSAGDFPRKHAVWNDVAKNTHYEVNDPHAAGLSPEARGCTIFRM